MPKGNISRPSVQVTETRYKGYRLRSLAPPRKAQRRMALKLERAGLRFGRLVVETCLGVAPSGFRVWGCRCDCGEAVAVRSYELDRGNTKSCGCLRREKLQHGMNKLQYGHASRNMLLASYVKSASRRGIAWKLSNQDFFRLSSGPCSYCGSPPNLELKPNKGVNGGYTYSGVDRVDNTVGYVPGNAVSCCWACNRAKGAMSLDAFLIWCDRVSAYSAARGARFEHGEKG